MPRRPQPNQYFLSQQLTLSLGQTLMPFLNQQSHKGEPTTPEPTAPTAPDAPTETEIQPVIDVEVTPATGAPREITPPPTPGADIEGLLNPVLSLWQ
jgi:hypothetical protein